MEQGARTGLGRSRSEKLRRRGDDFPGPPSLSFGSLLPAVPFTSPFASLCCQMVPQPLCWCLSHVQRED